MLKVGVIGCGMIAQRRHAPEYSARDDVNLCAWYDAMPERAVAMAKKYGGQVFLNWKELLEQELDAVSVCSPNSTHAEISIYALQNGIHVLCEKPMAISLKECDQMVMAAKKAGKLLFIGQNQRFAPAHIKARELIEKGVIGRPLRFETSFGHSGPEIWTNTNKTWFYDKKMAAFGAVFDLGIHKLDLLQFLLRDPYVQVGAMLGTIDKKDSEGKPIGVDDNAAVLLRTKAGVIGTMSASWTNYGEEDNSTRIYGTEGVMHIFEQKNKPLFVRKGTKNKFFKNIGGLQTNDNQFDTGIISAFVEDIEAGRQASASGEDVLIAMKAVFGAIESAQTGVFVNIK